MKLIVKNNGLYEVNGFYGTRNKGTILVYEKNPYRRWYCVKGSCNINCTHDEIYDGCNVEVIHDIDTMSSSVGIETIEELYEFIIN